MTADNSIAFVIILDPAQAHSVDLADLEDGDLDNEGEGPICHPMAVKDSQNILCDSVFFVQHQEADQDDDDGMVWIPVRKRSLGAWLVTRKVGNYDHYNLSNQSINMCETS